MLNTHSLVDFFGKEFITCGCGCGKVFPKYDAKGRLRTYWRGHQWIAITNAKIDFDELRRLYLHEGWSQEKLAHHFGVSRVALRKRLISLGIHKTGVDFRGEKNPAWKGGRHKLKSGYIVIYQPDHPRAMLHKGNKRYVYEHILVWEEANGRPLPDGWVVHHINGKRSDNRPENLLGLPKKSHNYALRLQAQQKRIRQLESEVKKLKTQRVMVL